MRGNSPVRFGKRPTEKDPSHGHLAGGLFHSEWGSGAKRAWATRPVSRPGVVRLRSIRRRMFLGRLRGLVGMYLTQSLALTGRTH